MTRRSPAVSGYFYPGDAADLRRSLEKHTIIVEEPETVRAAIAPHAGYVYSGPVAGQVYGAIAVPRDVLILGPNHTGLGVPLSLHPVGKWSTPLGDVEISGRLNEAILETVPGVEEDTEAHLREHCAEVQVPFLQFRNPEVRISVLIFGTGRLETLLEVGSAIARVIAGSSDPVLILSSSDMNHHESQAVSNKKDHLAIDRILRLDPEGLHKVVNEESITMCGYAPSVAAIRASKELGSSEARLLDYRTSSDETGDFESVVGYAGILIP